MRVSRRLIVSFVVVGAVGLGASRVEAKSDPWKQEFDTSACTWISDGTNPYVVLEPGFRLVLEGGDERLVVTVLDATVTIGDVATRVVEEREWNRGNLVEVSRNYLAICRETGDVFYFGEDVDEYSDGKVAGHAGAWRADGPGFRAGLIMPGAPRVGMRYYQEIAPGIAMDRAEVVSVSDRHRTPAGTFERCLKTREGSALHPRETEYKLYAPGIGLIQDADLLLTNHGFIERSRGDRSGNEQE